MFKLFKQTVNDLQSITTHRKDTLESKTSNPLFHRKKIKKKEVKVMSVGEQEVIGDSDLIEQRNRQFTLRCTSLEGELLVIKRDYFEEKIFKYQDTFNDLIRRCQNKQLVFEQRIDSIKNQLEIYSQTGVISLFHKKERSFTNLITDQQGLDRKLPHSPTQEKNQQFEYHKKAKLHINVQSKMEMTLPQIQTSFSPSVFQTTVNNYPTSTNQTLTVSPELKYSQPGSTRKDYENTNVSQFYLSNNHDGRMAGISHYNIQNESKYIQDKQRRISNNSTLKEETPERKEQLLFSTPRNGNLISYSQQKRLSDSARTNNIKYDEEQQTINNYYEPQSNNFNTLSRRKNRDQHSQFNQRDVQILSEDKRNSLELHKQPMASLTPTNNKFIESTLTSRREARILSQQQYHKSSTKENTNMSVNMESNVFFAQDSSNKCNQFSNKINQADPKIQYTNYLTPKDTYSNFRSISQQDVHTLYNDSLSTLPNGFNYNRLKKQRSKEKKENSKELIPDISQQEESKKIKKIQKSVQIPPLQLNLQEQQNKLKDSKKLSVSNSRNKQNGSHTERISSMKNDKEQIFMDSTYGYFIKKEEIAKEILTERNCHKPLLMEVKQTEQTKNDQNKKKVQSYHQQPMSQQEKILQTLIFQKKRIKKHLFSKIIGEEVNLIQQNQYLQQIYQQQYLQGLQTQGSVVTSGGKEVINTNLDHSEQGLSRKSQESPKYNYYYLNNSFDQQYQHNSNNQEPIINENSLSMNQISPVSQTQGFGISSNNPQNHLISTIDKKDSVPTQANKSPTTQITVHEQPNSPKTVATTVSTDIQKYKEQVQKNNSPRLDSQIIESQSERIPIPQHLRRQHQHQQQEDSKNTNNLNTYSILKNNLNIFPEVRNFNLDSESKFIFQSYQFLDPIRESQKYKVGLASIQNRYFKKSKQKMKQTRQKILELSLQPKDDDK